MYLSLISLSDDRLNISVGGTHGHPDIASRRRDGSDIVTKTGTRRFINYPIYSVLNKKLEYKTFSFDIVN